MKNTLILITLIGVIPLSLVEYTSKYDSTGRYKGYETTKNGYTRKYDSTGRYTGYELHKDGKDLKYDSTGKYLGTKETQLYFKKNEKNNGY